MDRLQPPTGRPSGPLPRAGPPLCLRRRLTQPQDIHKWQLGMQSSKSCRSENLHKQLAGINPSPRNLAIRETMIPRGHLRSLPLYTGTDRSGSERFVAIRFVMFNVVHALTQLGERLIEAQTRPTLIA